MKLWLKARRAVELALLIGLSAVLVAGLDGIYLPIPQVLSGYGVAVALPLLVPLVLAIAVGWSLNGGEPLLERVAARPTVGLDTGLAVLLAITAFAFCVGAQLAAGADLGFAAGRNTVGFIGLTLAGRLAVGVHAAPLVAVGYAVAASLFGAGPGGGPAWWAWPFAEADASRSWFAAGGLLLLGGALHATWPRRRSLPSD